ncbi:hypothetical protein GDO81_002491 [Engystomops pustulosus]|uniref:Uncharacterized protein n=1 Tax=Engystomops pustulosus TaxID=76066 RepID=A0AAV7DL88_ENGPU|nr:hypothetical protein GDO81_002491 [Engystomops pustulosus]
MSMEDLTILNSPSVSSAKNKGRPDNSSSEAEESSPFSPSSSDTDNVSMGVAEEGPGRSLLMKAGCWSMIFLTDTCTSSLITDRRDSNQEADSSAIIFEMHEGHVLFSWFAGNFLLQILQSL